MQNTLKINRIFSSIQGEGQKAGFPCVFVRLFGCNFECSWCDTLYAKRPSKEISRWAIERILEEIKSYNIPYVCITGGEPLLQEARMHELLRMMRNDIKTVEYQVEINTNGSFHIWMEHNLRWVVDYKLPSSGMWGKFDWGNIHAMDAGDDLMFVIRNKTDYDVAKEIVSAVKAENDRVVCNFSPCWGVLPKEKLIKWIIRDTLNVKFSLQLHKVVWGPNKRGV